MPQQDWDSLSKTPPPGWDKLSQKPVEIAQPHSVAPAGTKSVVTGQSQEPSAIDRFVAGANPMNIIRGLKTLVTTNPLDTIVKPSVDQLRMAADSAGAANDPNASFMDRAKATMEAAGHTLGAIPLNPGPALAEQAKGGDVAGAMGGLALQAGTTLASDLTPIALRRIGEKTFGAAAGTADPIVQQAVLSHGRGPLLRMNTNALERSGLPRSAEVHGEAVDRTSGGGNLISGVRGAVPEVAAIGAQGAYSLGNLLDKPYVSAAVRAAILAALQQQHAGG